MTNKILSLFPFPLIKTCFYWCLFIIIFFIMYCAINFKVIDNNNALSSFLQNSVQFVILFGFTGAIVFWRVSQYEKDKENQLDIIENYSNFIKRYILGSIYLFIFLSIAGIFDFSNYKNSFLYNIAVAFIISYVITFFAYISRSSFSFTSKENISKSFIINDKSKRKLFGEIFVKHSDGSIEPRQRVRVGLFAFGPNIKLNKGNIIGGIDFTQFIDHDLEIEKDGEIVVIKGIY